MAHPMQNRLLLILPGTRTCNMQDVVVLVKVQPTLRSIFIILKWIEINHLLFVLFQILPVQRYVWEVKLDIKQGCMHYFIHEKMPVPNKGNNCILLFKSHKPIVKNKQIRKQTVTEVYTATMKGQERKN